jgi:ABC-type nitrate/sulfonate/bicarbonate transport system substrate-binding protein
LEFIFGRGAMAMTMTMTIERVMAFMGLDVLVAKEEGLFAAEGLDLRITALPPDEVRSAAEGSPTKPTTNQGKLQARGEAQMFQA